MIVSLCGNVIVDENNRESIKHHLKNAVEYAISEGGKIFLSEEKSPYANVCKEVMEEVCGKYHFISYVPVGYNDFPVLDSGSTSGYTMETNGRKIRKYLIEKADFVIMLEIKTELVSTGIKSKNSVCIKI